MLYIDFSNCKQNIPFYLQFESCIKKYIGNFLYGVSKIPYFSYNLLLNMFLNFFVRYNNANAKYPIPMNTLKIPFDSIVPFEISLIPNAI